LYYCLKIHNLVANRLIRRHHC